MRTRGWLLAGLLAWPRPSAAEPELAPEPRPEPIRSPFWRALADPNYARAEHLVRQGRAQLYPALGLGLLLGAEGSVHRRVAIENALARFERALALAPDHREARLFYGKALAFSEQRAWSGEPAARAREAIAQFERLRRIDPLYEAQQVAFQLGVLHTRTGDFARAAAEYQRALALNSDDDEKATLLGNLAEVMMMNGELASALALYERAAREGEASGRLLALWGSAIVLDRLGERSEALERARRALREDRAPFAVLRQSGVFFVPAHELHYYEGLGYRALADAEREGSEGLTSLLARAQRWLAKPLNRGALASLEPILGELAESEQRALIAPLRARLAHAPRPKPPEPVPRAQKAELAPPAAQEARAMLWVLRSLAAFATYLRRDGGEGPFAEDARDHIAELARALPAP